MTNFKGMFKKIKPGMCRLSMNGIAININGEYKTYDVETGTFTNCTDFVFDVGDEMFFSLPTNNVTRGDIILAPGGPAAVIEVKENEIRAFDYKTGTIVNIVPEKYVFFGDTYFYSKIVSPFAAMGMGSSDNVMKMMMMQSLLKDGGEMNKIMAYSMMMNGGFNFDSMFGNMFSPGTSTATSKKEGDK